MRIRLLVKFAVKPQHIELLLSSLKPATTDLLKVPGCEAVELLQNADDPCQIVLAEIWASREIHDQFAAQMAAGGSMTQLAPLLDGEPTTEVYLIH